MKFIKIFNDKQAAFQAIEENRARRIRIGEQVICMARYEDKLYAMEDDCPHSRASLSTGIVNTKGEIVCPLHSYCYDLVTGREYNQLTRDARTFNVIEKEDGIFIEL